jgi:hypothetical protein
MRQIDLLLRQINAQKNAAVTSLDLGNFRHVTTRKSLVTNFAKIIKLQTEILTKSKGRILHLRVNFDQLLHVRSRRSVSYAGILPEYVYG